MAHNIGDRVGDYQIIDVLGAGGMGKVYKVRNVISERVEAMKVLLPNLATDPDLADRFMREIKVQASLQHPNIASLHTAQRVDNQLIMLIEFVEGSSLESILRKGPIPVPTAVDYIRQTLLALSYAHGHGVIHRDIKPANMMVTPAGVVKLMDFGIAKLSADQKLTQTGRTVGSLYYMSPEQIQGALDLDPRADLYSLGVSMYEMLTQTRPFQGDSDYSIMAAHLNTAPVPPVQLDPTLPSVLSDIILMAIAKEPGQRFQTADAFRHALETVEAQFRSAGSITKVIEGGVPVRGSATATAPLQGAALHAAAPEPKSRRGVYMAVGSLVTVAVLAVAALQAPTWFSGSEAASVASQQQPTTQLQSQPMATGTPQIPQPASEPAPITTAKPVDRTPSTRVVAQNAPVQTLSQAQPSLAPPQAALPPAPAPQAQTPPQGAPPAEDAAKAAALSEARERLVLLGSRANSARATLVRMKEQQARQGLGMRGDILTSEQRMETYLDQAEAAIRSGEPDRAAKSLVSAEREVDRLDSFLGR